MFATICSLGAFLAILLAVFGVGGPAVRYLRCGDAGNLAAAAWSLGVGFVLCGSALSALAFAGMLTPVAFSVLTAVGMFWGMGELACSYLALRNSQLGHANEVIDFTDRSQFLLPERRQTILWAAVVGLLLLATFVSALAPPISAEATSRTLEFAKTVQLKGNLVGLPPAMIRPGFGGVIYAWALFLDGPVAASLLSWCFGVLMAAATALLARSLVGRTWGWFAGSIILLVPGVLYQLAVPLDDLLLGMLVTFALAAWWRGAVELQSSRWFAVSGLFLGAALASKAVALVALVATAAAWIVELIRREEHRQEVCLGAAKTAAIAALIAGPWWVWVLAMDGQLSAAEPLRPMLVELGPWLLAAVPGVLLARRLRGLHLIGAIAFFYLVASWLIVPQSRSFAPLVPLLAIMATWGCMELKQLPKAPRFCATASLLAIAGIVVLGTLSNSLTLAPVALGWTGRGDFLRDRFPVYAAAEVANRVAGERAVLASEDPCGLYFDCPVFPMHSFSLAERLPAKQICEQLRRRQITHLLLCSKTSDNSRGDELNAMGRDAAAGAASADENAAIIPLTSYITTARDGEKVRYDLIMLR